MPKKSDDTKARVLSAATQEFAAHGIAGARVDRIAALASANKNLLYVYFGNKERLFETVYDAAVAELLDAAPFDPRDLPGYAGALFDFYRAHPDLMRLTRWRGLEQPGAQPLPAAREATKAKLQALAAAQAEGIVDAGLPPHVLLTLVLTLASTWTDGSPEAGSPTDDPETVSIRRHAVVVAVGRLTRPPAARLSA
ncbi:putative TetR family regulatory protein [Planotetraspora thailandica]|uniref:Putative TetR family regulatory protein n=1 Tax=Planotetraspora thailandica TaxID=487172 RepID=A0A8J3XXF8_9ACTN|nr:TetR family transcriptional regulator [Planotetraspora thailandica]GII55866.1 putative TetR family regulatory protein [Planotetraspora thailandica]